MTQNITMLPTSSIAYEQADVNVAAVTGYLGGLRKKNAGRPYVHVEQIGDGFRAWNPDAASLLAAYVQVGAADVGVIVEHVINGVDIDREAPGAVIDTNVVAEVSPVSQASTDTRVARPLHVLVPLIKNDLEQGKEAAQRAGLPFYQAAGEKMLEAKVQIKHGEFQDWIKRNFNLTPRHARRYMDLAEATAQKGLASPFSSLSDFVRQTSDPNYNKPRKPDIGAGYASRAEYLNQHEERDAQRELALRLIDAGFKLLSKELHPDKGGSPDVMTRLNQVRHLLKKNLAALI